MAWFCVLLAGVFEIVWAIALKYAEGFSKVWPSTITVLAMLLSVLLLAQSFKSLPVGTAYAVWTGVGTVGTAILGIYLFHESREVLRLVCILLIVIGIVGLKLVSDK